MKLPFKIYDSRFTLWKKSSKYAVAGRGSVAVNRQSPTANRKSQSGIALVITLILLSVTLVMAIAFLAISNRERGSVTTSSDTVTARLAADAALAKAQAQIIASIYATTNPYSASLLVSTNFINVNGFTNGISNPLNVNYDFLASGGTLNAGQLEQNIANLLYLPRAPVFVVTNRQTGSNEFRFYLDLNRNGQFDRNGIVTNVDNANNVIKDVNLVPVTNNQIGDPEWIGVLERPDVPHGPNNKFVSRYAFIAMPADGALDLNSIHNEASLGEVSPAASGNDSFLRNQGIGSWEINLAAFLADLNTNQWNNFLTQPYQYFEPGSPNRGYAFEDALALLSYRYAFSYNNLAFASAVLSANTLTGPVDIFPLGSVMANTATPFYNPGSGLNNRWAGADNTNHYFAPASDLFDPNKTASGILPAQIAAGNYFIGRLLNAGTNVFGGNTVSTYDRYTFYRMLSQLGTDSAPEQNKINVNYANAIASYNGGLFTGATIYPNMETNLFPWQPLDFFNIAADRMLRDYSARWFQADPSNYLATYYNIQTNYYYTDVNSNVHTNDPTGLGLTGVLGVPNVLGLTSDGVPAFGITNIPVLVNGGFAYTPAVQRVLQLAANIYDATTNKAAAYDENFPSVFRPVFYKTVFRSVTNVSIVGYQDVASFFEKSGILTPGFAPLDQPLDVYSLPTGYTPLNPFSAQPYGNVTQPFGNVYGVPWIVGAKKGFPNFNEFSMQDVVQVTRKLQVTRPNTNSLPNATNQMYVFSVTNYLGAEFWNSYTNGYTNLTKQVQVVVNNNLTMQMSLSNGPVLFADGFPLSRSVIFNPSIIFNGWPSNTFLVPFATNFLFLADSAYQFVPPSFYYVGNNLSPSFQSTSPTFAPLPQIQLQVTNHLQAFILNDNHILDYVHFSGPGTSRNLNSEFQNTNITVVSGGSAANYTNLIWSIVPDNSGVIPLGIATQIAISDGTIPLNTIYWKDPNAKVEIDGFRHFMNPLYASLYGARVLYSTNLAVQAPYTPTATIYEYTTYQANDPLVHYLKSDLNYFGYDPDPSSGVQTGVHQVPMTAPTFLLLPDLGKVNVRYMPWGRTFPNGEMDENGLLAASATVDQNPYNLTFKDPLMTRSDNWDFPTYKLPTVGWLGRVHRGTPWQTVYLKASDILSELNPANANFGSVGTNTWSMVTGNANHFDAVNAGPIQDRLLFDDFTTALNDNATRGQLSVNTGANGSPSVAAWAALFSGVVVLTNSTQFPQYQTRTNGWLTISPAGAAGNNSPIGKLVNGVNGINNFRANSKLFPSHVFTHVGDILGVTNLTEQSPFLNTDNTTAGGLQQDFGISDEVYEWLPQQTLSLLRVESAPRYVIYSYGQTLKPAANGVVSSAFSPSFFGLVTNYQVVAETATRAVVQVKPVVTTNPNGTLNTNYNLKIEQFNVLPPD